MNKKIFTLLVSVSMLLAVAFIVNANDFAADTTAERFLSASTVEANEMNTQADSGMEVSTPASTRSDEDIQYYRRLRSIRDDNATTEGPDHLDPEAANALDAPKVLRIVIDRYPSYFLHEDGLSSYSVGRGIGFLGIANSSSAFYQEGTIFPDGTVKYNYHLFLDTAFINRGTGNIKPQYMIAVGVNAVKRQEVSGKDPTGASVTKTIKSYVEGRYLINATDLARMPGSDGSPSYPTRNNNFLYDFDYDRLAFVDAIRVYDDDRLYIVSELRNNGVTRDQYIITTESGKEFIDGDLLDAMTKTVDRVPGKLVGKERIPSNNLMYGAYYQFSTWNNLHNDVCFSLRFVSPNAKNPDEFGADVCDNYEKRFYIESEAMNRDPNENPIAPYSGGWISSPNNAVAVLHRGTTEYATIFNVAELPVTDWQGGQATSNDNGVAEEKAIAGEGFITIYNAAGKHVVVSNLLGQTIVSKTLTSDNETVKASKGFVVVTIDGVKTFKLVVK